MKLVKILPDKIQIKTDDAEFKNCRLNDLISVSDGGAELVTQICAITDNDTETQMDDNAVLAELEEISLKVIECSILGSVVKGDFRQQLDKYPQTNATIKKVSELDFEDMLALAVDKPFEIGKYAGYDVPAELDGNKFYQRHSCIVGNTGCGKSETVTKIIEETANNTNCNIVIFDIHGEYSQLSYVDSIKIGKVPFPIWMLGFADMVANVLKVKEDSTVVMSALRKAYYAQCPNGNENKPIYFDFEQMMDFVRELNDEYIDTGESYKSGAKAGQPKYVKGDLNGKLIGIVNAMETIWNDRRYDFLFYKRLSQDYLTDFLNRIMGSDKPVKNIDLSGIPHDIAVLIIGAITKLIYNIQIMKKDARPITLVCDEAHVYIPTDFQLSAAQRRMVEIFENIAKEGRKFGITLFVASQRPSELNKTIMAQCANYIVMKLNNENDKSMIKGMMPAGSADVIETTTMFSPGDCLVVGDACPIPLKIHVEFAKERPQSKTIDFWSEWQKERESVDYGACLEEYLEN